ncbi:ribonuclease H family protein [Lactobacillus sp. ESL0684]|uniref:ribonuclease H family protein n=1 Tax=unclassified Lactobacillus TaxID=2620435 RepID=UPI0023FA3599|nr:MULTISPECIES: ribonuclease H family protein [unclassified Lactobacillus]WEV39914.1 ribonuclease H family protein [Lactobacillus sp. ESL0681]WEV43538.1 ribonuclease H family protein [Lactobacillus sp. ESL0684]
MKFYAVRKGREPGIYRSWDAAKQQVNGYSNAEYKSFKNITDATDYLGWGQTERNEVLQKDEDTLERAVAKIKRASQQVKPPTKPAKLVTAKRKPAKTTRSNHFKSSNPSDFFAAIYTDGGTRNTGNYKGGHVKATDKAAWAYLIEWQEAGQQQATSDSNGEFGATNNKMELTALIEALKKLIKLGFNQQRLLFTLDSQYVLEPINKGWLKSWKKRGWKKSSKGEIANLACWQELDQLLEQFTNTKFEWTKGHANNRGNEFVDHKLNQFMDQM